MRPIIFRAKRKDNGEWVEGDFVSNKYILQGYRVERGFVVPYNTYEVIPETVGQYTGELDFNGKKIFEGDIIQNKDGYVYTCQQKAVVKFEYGKFYGEGWCDFDPVLFHLCEVIGNIHDNKLEVEE